MIYIDPQTWTWNGQPLSIQVNHKEVIAAPEDGKDEIFMLIKWLNELA